MKTIVIIGAGPAGIMAALNISSKYKVILIEKQNTIGKKILVSGNGQCNLTNTKLSIDKYQTKNSEKLKEILELFDNNKLMKFFTANNIFLTERKNNKIYPYSKRAENIVYFFENNLRKKNNIEILLNTRVIEVIDKTDFFIIKLKNKKEILCDYLILATGNKAVPSLGGNDFGIQICDKLNIKTYPPVPCLTAYKLEKNIFFKLQGIKINSIVYVYLKRKKIKEIKGDVLFTKTGLSGNAILEASFYLNNSTMDNNSYIIINFLPLINRKLLLKKIERIKTADEFTQLLIGLLPFKFINFLFEFENINKNEFCPYKMKKVILKLFNWKLKIKSTMDFEKAQAAFGGIDINEINSETMQVKKNPRIFIIGELLDVTGQTGGYNMQFAFSSGYIAGSFFK